MPESPDFDTIARLVAEQTGVGRLEEWDADDPDRVVAAIATQLRRAWNGRGEADLVVMETQLSAQLGVTAAGPWVKNLERELKKLDR